MGNDCWAVSELLAAVAAATAAAAAAL